MTQELLKLVTIGETSFGMVREPNSDIRVGISGPLLMGNRDQLKQIVVDQLERGDRDFVLDCLRCGYVDASGLGVIVSLSWKAKRAGGTFRVENLNPDLVCLFRLTRLDEAMTVTAAPEVKP